MTDLEAEFERGAALHRQGRLAAAGQVCLGILRQQPDHFAALHLLGLIALQTGKAELGVDLLGRAVDVCGTSAEARNDLGNGLGALGRPEGALSSYDKAIALKPQYWEAHANRAATLKKLERLEEAVASFDDVIALKPDLVQAHNDRGTALLELNRHHEAGASFDKVIALQPDHARANWNRSLCHLALGEYERGWEMFEWRWKSFLARANGDLPRDRWLGDTPIDGKTILVRAEQGLGDSLQFCRYVPLLAARARVVLQVPRPLLRLLCGLEGVAAIVAADDPLPAFDAWTSMMSLPRVFRTTLETIPNTVPYLRADPGKVVAWQRRLAAFSGRKVGLVWAGSPRPGVPFAAKVDQRRSIDLRHYAALGGVPGLCLISLQKGDPAAQAREPPEGMVLHDWTDELDDLADTAALVEALDLVISVDTSMVHLAGALGKPVWVLNRYDQCWRWLRERSDSPWYPSARLFQQRTPRDWPGVIADVAEALRQALRGTGAPARV